MAVVMDADVDVVIVGAGLAGLACAKAVTEAGLTARVLEAGDGVGGRVRTDVVDGFRLDRGFQILLTGYPEVARQLDAVALDLRPFDPGSMVWTGSGFDRVSDPLRQPSAAVSTLFAHIGSLGDKARVARLRQRLVSTDPVDLLRAPDRTTAESLDALGVTPKMVRRFFRPLVGGIQLDGELTTSARMFDIIFRTLAIGDAAVPALGMQAIPDQLAASLPADTVRLASRVERIDATTAHVDGGGSVRGRAVVVATEGPTAADLIGVRDPGSKCVSALWFTAEEPPLRGRSIALDGDRSGPVANLAVLSEVAPTYAPGGRCLFVAACPGVLDEELESQVRRQMRQWFGSSVDSWELLRHDRIHHGQPLAGVPFSPKRAVALGEGRYVAGDHRDTPSSQGALFSGRRCGEAVIADLRAS